MTPEEQAAADKAAADKAVADKAEAERLAEEERRKDPKHVESVIARQNAEAKSLRERAEVAERKAAEAEARAKEVSDKLSDKEKAELAEKEEFKKLYEKEQADRKAAEEKFQKDLSTRDTALIDVALRAQAREAGILDVDDVDLPAFQEALKLAKVEGGRVVGIADAVAKMKELKPTKFKAEETDAERREREEREQNDRLRDEQGRFRPGPAKKGSDIDWSRASDADFEAKERELRASRV